MGAASGGPARASDSCICLFLGIECLSGQPALLERVFAPPFVLPRRLPMSCQKLTRSSVIGTLVLSIMATGCGPESKDDDKKAVSQAPAATTSVLAQETDPLAGPTFDRQLVGEI